MVQKAWGTYGSKICEWKQNQWETHFIKTEYIQMTWKIMAYHYEKFKYFYGTYNWNDIQSTILEKEKFELSIWNQFWCFLSQEVKGYVEWKKINFFKQSTLEYLCALSNPVFTWPFNCPIHSIDELHIAVWAQWTVNRFVFCFYNINKWPTEHLQIKSIMTLLAYVQLPFIK